jgi:hypothetical protein
MPPAVAWAARGAVGTVKARARAEAERLKDDDEIGT